MKADNALQDLRYTLRQLWRAPGFSLSVVLTLAVGIGAAAAVFTVVDTLLLRPLGYDGADRIYAIGTAFPKEGRTSTRIGGDDYTDLSTAVPAAEATAYYSYTQNGVEIDGHGEYLTAAGVSRAFGDVLGIQPLAGRLFLRNGNIANEALVSAPFARAHFGTAQAAIDRTLRSGTDRLTIVGVMPDGFDFPASTSVWLALPDRPDTPSRTAYNQRAILRVREGTRRTDLDAQLQSLSARLSAGYPEDRDKTLAAVPLAEQLVASIRPTLHLLVAAVAIVLLIVCVNIAHLQLVRFTTQRSRLALQSALGATRLRMAGLAALQNCLLATAGGALGLVLGQPLLRLLLHLAPADLPRVADLQRTGLSLNIHVLLAGFLAAFTVMLATAILPVMRSWHVQPADTLKSDAARFTPSARSQRLRGIFVASEVALTFLLCLTSAILLQALQKAAHADLGFNPDGLVFVDTFTSASTPGTSGMAHLNAVLDNLGTLPGVRASAAVSGAPSTSPSDVGYAVFGHSAMIPGAHLPSANVLPVTPAYFDTLGLHLQRGRGILATDTRDHALVAVISRSMANTGFGGRDPIGERIQCGYDESSAWMTVVGIVDDAVQESPAVKPVPTFYVPFAQHPREASSAQIVVRVATTGAQTGAMTQAIANRIRSFDPSIAVTAVTMRESLSDSMRAERFRSTLFASFAVLSILLAAVGMYGVMAYAVAERRFEFALRFAFGAEKLQVFGGVLRRSCLYTVAGLFAGSFAAFVLARLAGSLFNGVSLLAVAPWLAAAAAVLALTTIAAIVPAHRASSVEPMQALRNS